MLKKIYRDTDTGLIPAALDYLNGDDPDTVIERYHCNPWMYFSLADRKARLARDAWQRGDVEAAKTLLRDTPGGWNLLQAGG